MHKYYRSGYLALLFLPALVLMFTVGQWADLAIGALAPVSAIEALKGQSYTDQDQVNPFEDFIFNKDEQNQPSTATPTPTPPPPGYDARYPVTAQFFSSEESNIILKKDTCYVKNLTKLPADTVKGLMLSPLGFKVEKNSDKPQILIMHTHATESYQPENSASYDPAYSCRNTDTSQNMVAVGEVMCETLNMLGYNTLQDKTLHDHPSYNKSYDNSKATVEYYLQKYPSIKIVLDVHRDAIERNGERIAPTVSINGTEYAQIMIISGADNGYMSMPNYKENLKFATAVQNYATKLYPGLMRPVMFDYRNYNQQLTTGSVLLEMGSHANTLSQAKNSAKAFAYSLAHTLDKI